jgi:hypothetical protein
MIGFGFMDNLVMIQAGDAIDASFGVIFSLSTLTAAGFGQCFSDVAGITCGGLVDAAVTKMNLPRHGLSPDQLDLRVTRMWTTLGGCIGVVTGCLLGMSCLLFMGAFLLLLLFSPLFAFGPHKKDTLNFLQTPTERTEPKKPRTFSLFLNRS